MSHQPKKIRLLSNARRLHITFDGVLASIMVLLVLSYFVSVDTLFTNQLSYLLAGLVLSRRKLWLCLVDRPFSKDFLLFLSYMTFTVFWSSSIYARDVISVVGNFVLILTFYIALINSMGKFDRFLPCFFYIVLVISSLTAIYSIFDFLTSASPLDPTQRLEGFGRLGNPAVAGMVYGMVALYGLFVLKSTPQPTLRSMVIASTVVLIAAMILTKTRMAFVSYCLAAAYFYILSCGTTQRYFYSFIFLVVVSAIVVFLELLSPTQLLRTSLGQRDIIWHDYLELLTSGNILIGEGVLSNLTIVTREVVIMHPHNVFIYILFTGGVVGLMLYLRLLLRGLKEVNNSYAMISSTLLVFSNICLLTDGIEILSKFNLTWILLWVPFGICSYASNSTSGPLKEPKTDTIVSS